MTMTPTDIAKALCDDDPESHILFWPAMLMHALHGFVYAGPDAFLMMRAIAQNDRRHLTDYTLRAKNPDTWMVLLAAGDLKTLFEVSPMPMQWIAFARSKGTKRGRIKLYDYAKMRARVLGTA